MPATDDQTPHRDVLEPARRNVELLEEIRLMSELIVAASRSHRARLHRHEIDNLLGLPPRQAHIPSQGDEIDRVVEPPRPRDEPQ